MEGAMTRISRILFTAHLAVCPSFNGRSNVRSLLLIGAVLSWLAAPAFAASPERVEICHIPPDTPDNVQTIVVGPVAAEQHFVEHGDFEVGLECFEGVGECEDDGVTICVPGDDTCSATPDDPPETTEVSCADGLDNDCDGAVDADDPDCPVACPCWAGTSILQDDLTVFASQFGLEPSDLFCTDRSAPGLFTRYDYVPAATSFAAFVTVVGITSPQFCVSRDSYSGPPPPMRNRGGLSTAELDACTTILTDFASEQGCPGL
jgi:hypothetical protein